MNEQTAQTTKSTHISVSTDGFNIKTSATDNDIVVFAIVGIVLVAVVFFITRYKMSKKA
jgi:hypothetical protein